jgi:hypothetical protein
MFFKYIKRALLCFVIYTQTLFSSVPDPINCNLSPLLSPLLPYVKQDNPAINIVQEMKRALKSNNSIIAIIKTKAPSSESFKINCSLLYEIQEILRFQLEELSELPIDPEKFKLFTKRQRYFQRKLKDSQSFSRDMHVVRAILELK